MTKFPFNIFNRYFFKSLQLFIFLATYLSAFSSEMPCNQSNNKDKVPQTSFLTNSNLEIGGRFKSIPGPDLNSKKIETPVLKTGNLSLTITKGLNLRFWNESKGKRIGEQELIIGQLGFSSEDPNAILVNGCQSKIKSFDMTEDYLMAFCPHHKVSCTSSKSIVDYYFYKCQAKFYGRTTDGMDIDKIEIYEGPNAHSYKGNLDYASLKITVIPLDGDVKLN